MTASSFACVGFVATRPMWPGLVHHLQEEPRRVRHAHAGRVHLGVDVAGFRIDPELPVVLRIGQARHEAHVGDAAVGPDVAVDARGRAQRRVGGLAGHHDLPAAVVHHEVAGRGPLERGVVELAEPLQRDELRVVAELGHHRHAEEGQAQHVQGHEGPVEREHVGEGVGHRLHAARGVAALPDDGVGVARGPHGGALVDRVEQLEQVAALLFLGDFQQVDGGGHGREAFLREGRSGGGAIGRDAFGEVADYLIAASRGSTCEGPGRPPLEEARGQEKARSESGLSGEFGGLGRN